MGEFGLRLIAHNGPSGSVSIQIHFLSTWVSSKRAQDPQTSTQTRSHPAKRKKGGWEDGGGKSVASEWPASPSHVPLIGMLVEFSHIASMIWAKRAPFYYWGFTRPKKKNTPRVFYIPNAQEKHVFHEIFFSVLPYLGVPRLLDAAAKKTTATLVPSGV